MLDIYGLKNCDTCRKAKKALDGAELAYTFHDVREDNVTKAQISKWAKAVGTEKLLNKASTTWRNLPDADKGNVTDKKAIDLMAKNPALIKRPVIVRGATQIWAGWAKETQDALLG